MHPSQAREYPEVGKSQVSHSAFNLCLQILTIKIIWGLILPPPPLDRFFYVDSFILKWTGFSLKYLNTEAVLPWPSSEESWRWYLYYFDENKQPIWTSLALRNCFLHSYCSSKYIATTWRVYSWYLKSR